MLQVSLQLASDTVRYYVAFFLYYWAQLPINKLPILQGDIVARVHIFTLAQQLSLWHAPHYRAATFADDLRNNLRNVAVPGTGVPLSVFCYHRTIALFFVLVLNPVACLVAAAYLVFYDLGSTAGSEGCRSKGLAATYGELLLAPQHWLAIWRHNCVLMGWHALVTGSRSYRLEDKGTFLLEGDRLGLPVSPFYRGAKVFVKHKSIEGGMGIHVYRNFTHGGQWIIQNELSNSAQLASLLPADAPLSTLRVVTASVAWLAAQEQCSSARNHNFNPPPNNSPVRLCTAVAAAASTSTHCALPQVPIPSQHVSGCQPGPATSPLPLSAAVVRCLHNEGAPPSQFVEVVSSLRRQGMADPALRPSRSNSSCNGVEPLLPKFGLWGQQLHWQQQQQRVQNAVAQQDQQQQPVQPAPPDTLAQEAGNHGADVTTRHACAVVTAVWRAGLAGADTDHSSICYSVDTQGGMLAAGVTANHWYKLGRSGTGHVDAAASRVWQRHPESNAQVAGSVIAGMSEVVQAVVAAHMVAAPDLPLVGWDVALTTDGVFILEINLSCNLFNGVFDTEGYYRVIYQYLAALQRKGAPASGHDKAS